jgi:type II secretion system protein D
MLTNRAASGLILFLLVLLAAPAAMRAQNAVPPVTPDAPVVPATSEETVDGIQIPGNPASDVAKYYEGLTGKTLILDSQLNGPTLSIVVNKRITKAEAIGLIESVLILNGYSIVNVDSKTAKLLGPSKPARSEAVQLITEPEQLPPGDQIVSYFMPFRYLKSEEALNTFMQFSPFHPNTGNYVQVPSVNAVVITESAAIIRRLLALKEMIDVVGAKTVTEFIPLMRADAEKVVEILNKIFEKDDAAAARSISAVVQPGGVPVPPGAPAGANAAPIGLPGKVQVFADKRTNRVMVVAPEGRIPYIRSIVENLDVPIQFDEVLERPLRFVRAADVLPVLSTLLVEGKDTNAAPGAPPGADDKNGPNNTNEDNNNNNNSSSNSSSGGGGSGGLSLAETTSFSAQSTKPLSVIVGNARIIADRSVNKIIVIGPPEARDKAAKVLDMLDQRPKQVYLACVIGQLTLTNNLEFGIDYLLKFGSVRILGQGSTANISSLLANRNASINTVASTAATVAGAATTAASTALPVLSGLTVFGAIADGVDVLARALGTTGRFQVVSRPVIYTSNGQGALISSGQEVPVATGSQSFVTDVNNNNNAGGSFNTSIDYKPVVLKLDIRPLINSDREVTLEIKQRNDNVLNNVTIGSTEVPVIATQTLNTTVTVPNRQTIVLGGLISDQTERNQTGIPFLKDIPGIGYIFSTTTKVKTRKELIIMIQPFIVNSEDSLKEVNYIERANTSLHEHMFDEPVPVKRAELPGADEVVPEMVR